MERNAHTEPQRCDHSEGIFLNRQEDGTSRAKCLRCDIEGPPAEDFYAALERLQEGVGKAEG
jgi:hypothetical protein